MTQYPSQLHVIEAHIRRRLRCRIVSQQKRRRHLYEKLVKRGAKRHRAAVAYSSRGKWALSATSAVNQAYSVRWFTDVIGHKILSEQNLPHWFTLKHYIKLT